MFNTSSMLFFYVTSPLHAGTGRSLAAVDLPIQRERTTNYPTIQGSSIKGQFRAVTKATVETNKWLAMFGPENSGADHAGALMFGDARLLLFPVRSLTGVFTWVTSLDVLARFCREMAMGGLDFPLLDFPEIQDSKEALVATDNKITPLVLEEFSFEAKATKQVNLLADWLVQHALPKGKAFDYWRAILPSHLCILKEQEFRDFVVFSTEVQTHIKIDPETKTVLDGALWTSEMLPVDTLLYSPLMAANSYRKDVDLSGKMMIEMVKSLDLPFIRLGGDASTGQGVVAVRIFDKE